MRTVSDTAVRFPRRIVCLAAEAPEILYRLGVLDRVVGISAYTTRPKEALSIPKVGGFQYGSPDRIMELNPDLVILTSGVQKELGAELAARGATLLHFNPHRLEDLFATVQLLGNVVNRSDEAEVLCADIQSEIKDLKQRAASLTSRPKVYFEEWMEPRLCGTGWVSDLIEIAGGHDVFREKSIRGRKAAEREVRDEEVVMMQPDIILASWCGKPFERKSLVGRPGYGEIPAVQKGSVFEVNSEILQFGPMVLDSARQLVAIFLEWSH